MTNIAATARCGAETADSPTPCCSQCEACRCVQKKKTDIFYCRFIERFIEQVQVEFISVIICICMDVDSRNRTCSLVLIKLSWGIWYHCHFDQAVSVEWWFARHLPPILTRSTMEKKLDCYPKKNRVWVFFFAETKFIKNNFWNQPLP